MTVPFSSFFIQLLFSNLKKKPTPELYLTRAGYQFEDLEYTAYQK